jgi:hypothetical protein
MPIGSLRRSCTRLKMRVRTELATKMPAQHLEGDSVITRNIPLMNVCILLTLSFLDVLQQFLVAVLGPIATSKKQ